jgi:hypothetical protein
MGFWHQVKRHKEGNLVHFWTDFCAGHDCIARVNKRQKPKPRGAGVLCGFSCCSAEPLGEKVEALPEPRERSDFCGCEYG